ncbi:MAG: SPASM domain-containing protein [Planctomycetota bacterium]
MAAPSKIDRELANFVTSVQSIARGETEFKHGPSTLEFAWTSQCNLRCVMCSQSDNPPVMKVTKEKAAPFLDKVFESVVIWNPSATSEPLLNDVDEMLRICDKHGVYLELYTNATRLSPAVFDKIAHRIHRLTLSIDSHVPEVLEAVREPIKAAKVFPNIEYALRRSAELSIPCVINAVLMTETLIHFPELVDWVADRGGKEITILDMIDGSSQAKFHDAFEDHGVARVEEVLNLMKERSTHRGVNLTFLLREPYTGRFVNVPVSTRIHEALVIERFQESHASNSPGFCPMVTNYLKVLPDGDAYPCCRGPLELRLGNVYEEGMDAVWNGEKAQALRKAMYTNNPPEPCKNCLIRTKAILDAKGNFETKAK